MLIGTNQRSVLQSSRSAEFWRRRAEQQEGCSHRACAWTARGSISKAMKGLVRGAAQRSPDCRRNWATALIPRSSGTGTHPTSAECAEAAQTAWGGGRYKLARSAMREAGSEQNRDRTPLHSLFSHALYTCVYTTLWLKVSHDVSA